MNSNHHPFNFDPNFGFGSESVFTDVKVDSTYIPPPPAQGFFLELEGGAFLLLNGENLILL